jgi:hypothetical protein
VFDIDKQLEIFNKENINDLVNNSNDMNNNNVINSPKN